MKGNKLYALLTDVANLEYDSNSIEVDGKKLYYIKDEVKDVFAVEFGQNGYIDAIITDMNGQAYEMNQILGMGEPFGLKKINGATNVVKAYTLNGNDAMEYILVVRLSLFRLLRLKRF